MIPPADKILLAAVVHRETVLMQATNEEAAAMGEERPYTVDTEPTELVRAALMELGDWI